MKRNLIYILRGGSSAIHCLGDIKWLVDLCRKEDDLFIVRQINGDFCFGNFVYGFGFIDVRVNKKDLRAITEKEWEKKWSGSGTELGGIVRGFKKHDFAIAE
jgi:hypothetical protein